MVEDVVDVSVGACLCGPFCSFCASFLTGQENEIATWGPSQFMHFSVVAVQCRCVWLVDEHFEQCIVVEGHFSVVCVNL